MKKYKILLSLATRSRPHRALKIINDYMKHIVDLENFHMNVCCDVDDITMNNDHVRLILNSHKNLSYFFDENKTKLDAVNAHIGESDWDIVIGIQDDLQPKIVGFDNIIREEMENAFNPDLDGVLFLFDGNLQLCSTPCMGRKFYDRFGYLNFPKYKSMFADNELTEVATRLGKLKKINDVLLIHNHPTKGNTPWDKLYEHNQSFWDEDQKLFNHRKKNNFFIGGH